MLPWPTHTGVSESPRGNYRVRGPYSPSGDSRYRRKNAEGVSCQGTCNKSRERPPQPTHPCSSSPAGWLPTGPGQTQLPTLARGLECPGTQPGLMGWEWVTEPVPLSSYKLGTQAWPEIPPCPRYSGDRLPDLKGGLGLQRRSFTPGHARQVQRGVGSHRGAHLRDGRIRPVPWA